MFVSQKTELVVGHGIYIHYSQLKQDELQSKVLATRLMRGLVSVCMQLTPLDKRCVDLFSVQGCAAVMEQLHNFISFQTGQH